MEYSAWERRTLSCFQMLEGVFVREDIMCLATETQSLRRGYRDAVLLHYNNQWLSNDWSLPHHNTGRSSSMECSSKGCKSTSSII